MWMTIIGAVLPALLKLLWSYIDSKVTNEKHKRRIQTQFLGFLEAMEKGLTDNYKLRNSIKDQKTRLEALIKARKTNET